MNFAQGFEVILKTVNVGTLLAQCHHSLVWKVLLGEDQSYVSASVVTSQAVSPLGNYAEKQGLGFCCRAAKSEGTLGWGPVMCDLIRPLCDSMPWSSLRTADLIYRKNSHRSSDKSLEP